MALVPLSFSQKRHRLHATRKVCQAKVHCPAFTRQSERILPQLDVLERQIEARKVQASPDAPAAEPEMVLVIETIGLVSGLHACSGQGRWT